MNRILLLMFPIMILISCDEQRCNPDLFSGISATDVNGQQLSDKDPDDWNFDDDWGNGIKNFFSSDHDIDCNPGYSYRIIAYPNPCGEVLSLYFDKDSATTVDLRLLNYVCGTLLSVDGITSNNVQLQVNNNSPERIVRLYYKFIKDNCEYQGHGDIYTE